MQRKALIAATVAGAVLGWATASPTLGEKTADVRLWDVLVLGPWLLVIADRGEVSATARLMLAVAGGATVTHNLRNMLAARSRTQ